MITVSKAVTATTKLSQRLPPPRSKPYQREDGKQTMPYTALYVALPCEGASESTAFEPVLTAMMMSRRQVQIFQVLAHQPMFCPSLFCGKRSD